MLTFLVTILAIFGLLHWFLYVRLVTALEITSAAVLWPLRILAVVLALSYLIARMIERAAPGAVVHVLDWVSSLWLGLMWELLWITFVFYLIKVALNVGGVWSRFDPATVTSLGLYSTYAVVSLAVLLCGYGVIKAMGPSRIHEVRVAVKNITPELRNLRIVEASDFHASALVARPQIRRMAEQIMAQNPDVILLPGDIVDQTTDGVMRFADAFRLLKAPLGVYGTTGNHEYYVGLQRALDFCQSAGIHMLMNETVELPGGLLLAGIEDRTAKHVGGSRPTVTKLLNPVAQEKPTILMNHTPATDEADEAARAGADLIVCGHTHGGQIWPFSLLVKMAFKYNRGLYDLGHGCSILVSTGIGTWGPPMRIGATPEILVIHLVGRGEDGTKDEG